jgi:hypothetical protein
MYCLTSTVGENLTEYVPVLFVHGVKCWFVFCRERGLSENAVLNKRKGVFKYLLSASLLSSEVGAVANFTSFGLERLQFNIECGSSLPPLQVELVGVSYPFLSLGSKYLFQSLFRPTLPTLSMNLQSRLSLWPSHLLVRLQSLVLWVRLTPQL